MDSITTPADDCARSFKLASGRGFAMAHRFRHASVTLCLMIGNSSFSLSAISVEEARAFAEAINAAADFAEGKRP